MKTLQVTGTGWWVALGAFRRNAGDPRALVASATKAAEPALVQLADVSAVAGWTHLRFAAVNAVTGPRQKRSIPVETLLTLSCQSQISRALKTHGVSEETTGVAAAVFAETREGAEDAYRRIAGLLGAEDENLLNVEGREEKLKRLYGVTDQQLEAVGGRDALARLLVERGALLRLSG